MVRQYRRVGDVVTAAELSALAGVRVFVSGQARRDAEDPQVGALSVVHGEPELAIWDGTIWRRMDLATGSRFGARRTLRRVPPTPVRWSQPVGAVAAHTAAAAIISGDWPTVDGRLFARPTAVTDLPNVVGDPDGVADPPPQQVLDHLVYTAGSEDFVALANATFEALLVGGGGSGAGVALDGVVSVGGVPRAAHPRGGGGGGSGDVVLATIPVRAGDRVSVVVGVGGVPVEVAPVAGDYSVAAAPRAGAASTVAVNGVVVAVAAGGAGGRDAALTPAAQLFAGRNVGPGYAFGGGGGGGMVPAAGNESDAAPTSAVPAGWRRAQLGHRVAAGGGGGGNWAAGSVALAATSAQHAGGGGGLAANGQPLPGAAGRTEHPTDQPVAAGVGDGWAIPDWAAEDLMVCGGGGGGIAHASPTPPTTADYCAGSTSLSHGSGGGGGGCWYPAAITAAAGTPTFATPTAGQTGAVWLRHALPAHQLVATPTPAVDIPVAGVYNAAPLPPQVVTSAEGEVPIDFVLSLSWQFADRDPGDVQTGYEIRRRISAGVPHYFGVQSETGRWLTTPTIHSGAATSANIYPWQDGANAPYHFGVRTYDKLGAASPWVDAAVVNAVAQRHRPLRPGFRVSPFGDVLATRRLLLTWNFSDRDRGDTQSAYEIRRAIDGGAYQFRTVSGGWAAEQSAVTILPGDATRYFLPPPWGSPGQVVVFRVRVRDQLGLWSRTSAGTLLTATSKTITVAPPSGVGGLPATVELRVGAAPHTIPLVVTPATVSTSVRSGSSAVTASVGNVGSTRTLTLVPVHVGTGDVTVTASAAGYRTTTHTIAVSVLAASLPAVTISQYDAQFVLASGATYADAFTVSPPNATVVVTTSPSTIATAVVVAAGAVRRVTYRASSIRGGVATATIRVSAANRSPITRTVEIRVTPPAAEITVSGLRLTRTVPGGRTFFDDFTVTPATAGVAVESLNPSLVSTRVTTLDGFGMRRLFYTAHTVPGLDVQAPTGVVHVRIVSAGLRTLTRQVRVTIA